MPTPWPFLESETLHRINALKTDSVADAVASYEAIPKTTSILDDPAFALTSARQAIVDTVMEIASYICKADGDPRRQMYRLTALVGHGGELPSSMGPYGAISDQQSGRTLEPRSATEIGETRANINSVFGSSLPSFFYYAIDGLKLYHTLTGDATVEYFDNPRPAMNYNALNELFASANSLAPIPDEFDVVAADGAAGRLAGKAGSLIGEAARFMELYYAGLKDRGLNVRVTIDYPATPAA